jgi:nucleotide-binding universal stress UspA family protein
MAGNIIVFPTDFSARSAVAADWVARLTKDPGSEVHVLYVVEEPHIYTSLDMGPIPIPSVEELTASAEKRMAAYVGEHLKKLPKVVTRVLVGRPAEAIVKYATEKGATMIVMTTHGYSGVRHVLLGSTTEAVLRHAACPVLSIRSL